MSIIKVTDSVIKLAISILFRAILIIYAVFLISVYQNHFSIYWYLLAICIYIAIYSSLFNKHKLLAFLRLVNDYAFMGIILYGKPLENLQISLFLLLPLLNNINHSGKRKIRPFSVRLSAVILITHFIINDFKFNWLFLTSIFAISLINSLISFRFYLINYVNNLYSIIEEFYRDNLNIGKTHRILKEVVKRHEQNKFVSRWIPLRSIILFQLRDEKGLKILLSSEFIANIIIKDNATLCETLLTENSLSNQTIVLDGRESKQNLFLIMEYKANKYVFFVDFYRRPPIDIALNIYVTKVLEPLFSKIVQVAYTEYQLSLENKKYFKELKNRMESIETAVNAIHYLNNKLSPVLNYFEMLRLLPETEPSKVDQLKELIETEKKNAIDSLAPITAKMNQMAEKTMIHNIISETKIISLRKLFSIVRNICEEDNAIQFNYSVEWNENTFDKKVLINLNLISYVIEELIINLKKYSTGSCVVTFHNKTGTSISFKNQVKNIDKQRAVINKVTQDFNQENVNEMMKRSSTGLRMVKQYLIQQDIKHKMTLLNENLILTLTLKIEDGNSNI
ncbi:hypothetical protein SAMN05421820_101239 [Pedobacter steynii]|uniref:Uncharacterized protein n=2 Tax=Pedobacter steynii TaxID=430522 RepID=A0A1G9JFI9_9SPHI|nr:hypothetical protein SAMN05421820_101239 [Pedobacter steynii]